MPHRPSDSSRPRQRLLHSANVHQNPGPAIKYPCSVRTSNTTSRGVRYMCNRCSGWVHWKCSGWVHWKCSGWVHWKCSGLQNVAEYRRIKNWSCRSCSSPPTPPIPQPLPSLITTKASDEDPFTILQFKANVIGNKQVELGELTSDIATGFNQRKPPHRAVCVTVDVTAVFDTVNHNVLLSKIVR